MFWEIIIIFKLSEFKITFRTLVRSLFNNLIRSVRNNFNMIGDTSQQSELEDISAMGVRNIIVKHKNIEIGGNTSGSESEVCLVLILYT